MFEAISDYTSAFSQKVLSIIPAGVCITDINNSVLFWNRAAEIITGYHLNEIKEGSIFKYIDLDSIGSNTALAELKQPGKTKLGILLKHKHKLGGYIDIEYHKNPLYNERGDLIGSIAIFHDKTNEMEKIKSQKKFYSSISEYLSFQTVQAIYNSVHFGMDHSLQEKDLTVAFIDLVNYTAICEQYNEETIMRMLNVFYDKTASFIRDYKGNIDKYIGDCVLGYFERPDSCIKAAKELLGEGLFSINKKLKHLSLPEISFRIGVDTGKVKIGNIGGIDRREFTIIGDVVNTASRVQGIAEPRTLVITEQTYNKLINRRGFVFLKDEILKGKNKPVKLYSLHYGG